MTVEQLLKEAYQQIAQALQSYRHDNMVETLDKVIAAAASLDVVGQELQRQEDENGGEGRDEDEGEEEDEEDDD